MVSVVIPFYNEVRTLPHCLNGLVRQTTREPFEVVAVDNMSTDGSSDVVRSFRAKLSLVSVHEKQKGRGAARAAGFAVAHGDIIFSTDADSTVPENWIDSLLARLADHRIAAVTGTCKITDCSPIVNAGMNIAQPVAMKCYRALYGHYWLSGFNFAIRRESYERSGGFNRNMNALEDIDLGWRVCKVGRIAFIPDTPVTTSGRRYQDGVFSGVVPYFSRFIRYFYFHNEQIAMSDIRAPSLEAKP